MSAVLAEQRALNLATEREWRRFGPHRRRVTTLLLGAPGGRLCVLGAGNCNDLELRMLDQAFDEVHLVDVDGHALAGALARQRVRSTPTILHGGVDVTANTDWADGLGRFDTVLSAGLLTQLIASAVGAVPEHEAIEAGLEARATHLRLLVDLLRPGGRGILVTELVSSDTFPELDDLPANLLGPAARRLIAERNFFTGTNPFMVVPALKAGARVRSARVTPPWRWCLGARRSYLAYAVVFDTAGG